MGCCCGGIVLANVFHDDSDCIALTGIGTPGSPLIANPIISTLQFQNILSCGPNGLEVPGMLAAFNSNFTPFVAGPVPPAGPYPLTILVTDFTLSLTNPSAVETYLVFAHQSQRLSGFALGGNVSELDATIEVDGGGQTPTLQTIMHLLGPVSTTPTNGIQWSMGDQRIGPIAVLAPLATINVRFRFFFHWEGPLDSPWDASVYFFETDSAWIAAWPFF